MHSEPSEEESRKMEIKKGATRMREGREGPSGGWKADLRDNLLPLGKEDFAD